MTSASSGLYSVLYCSLYRLSDCSLDYSIDIIVGVEGVPGYLVTV